MAKLTGLGKGLDALFAENTVDENGYELVNIDDVSPNREQPRRASTRNPSRSSRTR